MSFFKYIIRSLVFFKKPNLGILAGTIMSTAILTGAMIVGDSVKFSLYQLVEKRLGETDFALRANNRFFTQDLAPKLQQKIGLHTAGVLSVNGVAVNPNNELRLYDVAVFGVDDTFWGLSKKRMDTIKEDEVFISKNTADRLKVKPGDFILVRLQQQDAIPVNTPFAQEKNSSVSLRLQVGNILDEDHLGRFSLQSNQKAPFNVWVNKSVLQKRLNLGQVDNTLLVDKGESDITNEDLNAALAEIWTFKDAALTLKPKKGKPYLEINSERVFIDHSLSDKINSRLQTSPILTYLVNGIYYNHKQTPYSFVSGLPGELLPKPLSGNEIIINEWCATDLGLNTGDSVQLDYYVIGPYRELQTQSETFIVKAIEPNQGNLFQPGLMPDFPGLSDAESCSEWDTGIPVDLKKIRDKDEQYWNKFKGTPKAIISLQKAVKLWGNAFGNYTAIRSYQNMDSTAFAQQLNSLVSPEDIGLQFTDVRERGNRAAKNSVNFGELFLSLSFFVIAAAVLLLVLVYVLNMVARKKEIGTLTAVGFPKTAILKLFLGEAVVSIILGSLAGVVLGVFYNELLLAGLNTLWQDAVRTHALVVYLKPMTLIIGFASGLIIAFLSVFIVIRQQLRQSVAKVVSKQYNQDNSNKRNGLIFGTAASISIGLVVYAIVNKQIHHTALFLSAGALVLVALIALFSILLKTIQQNTQGALLNVWGLGLKNLNAKRKRSIIAIVLLALGTFSVIITGANRKTFSGYSDLRQSGTGGFLYWVETSFPINKNLNSKEGQKTFNFADEPVTDSIEFVQMLTLQGDDASCLNLNQVQQPRILGIPPHVFHEKQAFSFANVMQEIEPTKPWLELNKTYGANCIPAYLDQTVITWGLMKKVGDTLRYTDEWGHDLFLIIAGGLESSVFQGNVLIADKNFRKFFPSSSGSQVMLIDGKQENRPSIEALLGFYFRDYGIEYTLTEKRLAEFNSVTNTYLNVFMMLGGLGLILGTIGFGLILLRNKWERKQELALLLALGYTKQQVFRVVFTEHVAMLMAGLFAGLVAAVVGMLPSLLSADYSVPIGFIALILGIILLNGMLWIILSARNTDSENLIQALRSE